MDEMYFIKKTNTITNIHSPFTTLHRDDEQTLAET